MNLLGLEIELIDSLSESVSVNQSANVNHYQCHSFIHSKSLQWDRELGPEWLSDVRVTCGWTWTWSWSNTWFGVNLKVKVRLTHTQWLRSEDLTHWLSERDWEAESYSYSHSVTHWLRQVDTLAVTPALPVLILLVWIHSMAPGVTRMSKWPIPNQHNTQMWYFSQYGSLTFSSVHAHDRVMALDIFTAEFVDRSL